MLSVGATAPSVVLPGYVDGERERVDLGAALGDEIVVLAFYPADFNPGCSMQSSDLGDLDLFTMQKDVSVFAVSPDSTYSHEAFAERYSLRVPLLSDVDGEAASAYGVELETETGERLCERAVFVVDHRGEVVYAWATDDLAERVDVDPVKQAVGDIGGDETALERYRLGVERYAEGREAFTTAMADYEEREWMPARGAFEAAEPAFSAEFEAVRTDGGTVTRYKEPVVVARPLD
jgi:peroxiredoxin